MAAIDHIAARATGQQIIARPAEQGIIAAAALDRIVSAQPFQPVRSAIAAQRIGELRTDQRLNSNKHVALRIAHLPDAAFQICADQRCRIGIGDGIITGAARNLVCARAAIDQIVTGPGINRIIAVAAFDPVIPAQGRDRIVTRPGQHHIGKISTDNEITRFVPDDPVSARCTQQVIRLATAGDHTRIEIRHSCGRKAGIEAAHAIGIGGVGDLVFDHHIAREARSEVHHHELFALPVDNFRRPGRNPLTTR